MIKKILIPIVVVILLPGAAFCDLIQNGDFETSDLTGWNASGNVNVPDTSQYHATGGTGNFPTGDNAADFGPANLPNTGVISQDITTTGGQAYELSFDYGRFGIGAGGPQSIKLSVEDVVNGNTLFETTITDSTGTLNLAIVLDAYNFQFNASSSLTRIQFADVSGGTVNTDGLLDNVSLSAVPEILLGDVNMDGVVNLLDVAPFVDAISTGTFIPEADVNQDGVVNLLDVGPFVVLLSG